MKEESRNYVLVGAFVVAMVLSLILWLALLSGRTGATDAYRIRYESVLGLRPGTQVYYQGYPIGTVETITPIENDGEGRLFELSAHVQQGWFLPEDSVAEITASGLLSAVVIDIEAGRSTRALSPGALIDSIEPTSLMTVVADAASGMSEFVFDDLRPQLESLVANLDQTIGQVADFVAPENAKNVALILENLGAMSEETQRLVVGLDETRGNLDTVVGRLDQLLAANDDDIRTAVSDLQQAIEALARRSEAVASNLEDATRNANEFSRQLRANPGVLLRGREADPGGQQ